jgi:hypothetical protein
VDMGSMQPCVPSQGVHLDEPSGADDGKIGPTDRLEEGAGRRQLTALLALDLLGLLQVASIGCRRGLEGAAADPPVNLSEQADRLRSVH